MSDVLTNMVRFHDWATVDLPPDSVTQPDALKAWWRVPLRRARAIAEQILNDHYRPHCEEDINYDPAAPQQSLPGAVMMCVRAMFVPGISDTDWAAAAFVAAERDMGLDQYY